MRARFVILVVLGVFLTWEVVTRGVTAYLAEASPELAIGLRASQATALLNLAEKRLSDLAPKVEPGPAPNDALSKEVQSQQSLDGAARPDPRPTFDSEPQAPTLVQIRTLAERALANEPLSARALRILGRLLLLVSDDQQAEAFMHAAARRSLFESDAVTWMMQKSYQDQNYHAAIGYADTLLRTRENVFDFVMPILGRMAENKAAAGELRQLLSVNTAWRQEFFRRLPGSISDARTPLGIFLSLKDTAAPPTNAELRDYLNFLVGRKLYELAYYTWLQFLPPERLSKVGNLFNGGFEVMPSGLPFDWVWDEKPGATIQIATRPDHEGGRALYIEFGSGRVDFPRTNQLIMLPPGGYQFRGSYQADIISPRGLQWRITCAGGKEAPIGESSMVTRRGLAWQDFEFSFTVPKADCPAQYVTLVSGARSASEQFISGTIWYDDLKIVNELVIAPLKGAL